MDTPQRHRGFFYSTHLMSRCPSFSKCVACQGCQNYNPFWVVCQHCEKQKGKQGICRHRVALNLKQLTVDITNSLKRPMYSPEYAPQTFQSGNISNEHGQFDKILDSLPGEIRQEEDVLEQIWRQVE